MSTGGGVPYVECGGELSYCQPLQLQGVKFYSFLLDADGAALQALCDRRLNDPARGRVEYRPLLPRVMFAVADIEKAFCTTAPYNQMGWMSEIDVAFWVPVVAVKRLGGVYVAQHLAWFQPYLYVNNSMALATGREVYGFPKALGQFQVPGGPGDEALFTVDALVVERYGPQPSQAQTRRLLEARRTDAATLDEPAASYHGLREAVEDFVRMFVGADGAVTLPGLGLAVQVFDFLVNGDVPLVFLKQFRDVRDGTKACYQAVVKAPARVLRFHGGGRLPGTYRVTVNPYDSCPIVKELGLGGAELTPTCAWFTRFDFVMENGTEVGA